MSPEPFFNKFKVHSVIFDCILAQAHFICTSGRKKSLRPLLSRQNAEENMGSEAPIESVVRRFITAQLTAHSSQLTTHRNV